MKLDHFNATAGFLEYLEIGKFLCKVTKITSIIRIRESEFNLIE